jgi:hypothetical protein
MRAFVFLFAVLVSGAALAEPKISPDNACALSSPDDSPTCKRFFAKIDMVRATLRAIRSTTPAQDVCEALLELEKLDVAEYSDCYRILHADQEMSAASK